jgi:hypothetical protein
MLCIFVRRFQTLLHFDTSPHIYLHKQIIGKSRYAFLLIITLPCR